MTATTLTEWLASHDSIDALIGKRAVYAGADYEVVDMLQEEGTLVLGSRQQESVQEDRYGRAHRLVPRTEMIRLRDEHGQPSHICEEIMIHSDA